MLVDRQDVLCALRSARRTPLLTVVVVLALTLGIGLNAGVFSILNTLFLRPPTSQEPATFAKIFPQYQGWFSGAAQFSTFNVDDFNAIRAQSRSFRAVAAWGNISTMLDDVRQQGASLLVTADYFRVYGIDSPLMGRYFLPEELAATMLVRSFALTLDTDPGFHPEGVLAVNVPLAKEWDKSYEMFLNRISPALQSITGVQEVAAVNSLPMTLAPPEHTRYATRFGVVGNTTAPGQFPTAQIRWCTANYFHVLGIPLESGRLQEC